MGNIIPTIYWGFGNGAYQFYTGENILTLSNPLKNNEVRFLSGVVKPSGDWNMDDGYPFNFVVEDNPRGRVQFGDDYS